MKNVPKAFDDEFKTPEEGCNLLVSLLGDFDDADRAEQKSITVQFALDALKEAERYGE